MAVPFVVPPLAHLSKLDPHERLVVLLPMVETQVKRIGRRDLSLPEELRSAGTLRLWKLCQSFELSSFKSDSHFQGVYYQAMRRAMLDVLRDTDGRMINGKWNRPTVIPIDGEEHQTLPESRDSPAVACQKKDECDRVLALLVEISPASAKVMRSVFLDDTHPLEVAKRRGISSRAVYSTIKKAKERLREAWSD